MTSPVTVGVDGSPSSLGALSWAASLSDRSDAGLLAVLAWNYPLGSLPGLWGAVPGPDQMHEIAKTNLTAMIETADLEETVETRVCQGGAARCLMDAASESSLLVVGRRGVGGFTKKGLGSTSHQVALHAETSVAVVGDEVTGLPTCPKIVVAVDGSDRATDALIWVLNTFDENASVVAVYSHDEWVLDEQPTDGELVDRLNREAESRLVAIAREARASADAQAVKIVEFRLDVEVSRGRVAAETRLVELDSSTDVKLRVVHGDPRTTVLDVAAEEGADIVVLGSQGRTGLVGALLGSLTTHVIHHCPPTVSVVVVRSAPE